MLSRAFLFPRCFFIRPKRSSLLGLATTGLLFSLALSGCGNSPDVFYPSSANEHDSVQRDTTGYLVAIEDEPNTVDFQHTTIHYTIAQNVFDRLVEMDNDEEGKATIYPSLAKSWELSPDQLTYTFHLEENVLFSNGSSFTASDVEYTFTRLIKDPFSANGDILACVYGADELKEGSASELAGLNVIDDFTLSITLTEPFYAFPACLSMPGASILDAETTLEAGDRFGSDPAWTIGTGPYILDTWVSGEGMLLRANTKCWSGPPANEGLDLRFITDPEKIRMMFEDGDLDILNLDDLGKTSEYFLHGNQYEGRVYEVPRIGITYIALNESIYPLNNPKVRKALQLALNRPMLLDAAYSGNGHIENGIMPHGLYGFNPELSEIPYDPEGARRLLEEEGYPQGVSLTLRVSAATPPNEVALIRVALNMWEEAGIHVSLDLMNDNQFLSLRKCGAISCYCATWSADFNDPDNFFYTFFGNAQNSTYRSLCYTGYPVMERVKKAREIENEQERIQEYQELEKKIVQEDAAWIPLFSRSVFYVASKRIDAVKYLWNGSVKGKYSKISIVKGNKE